MTRAQMEAARGRVAVVLRDAYPDVVMVDQTVCNRLVSAVLGHPDGKVPRAKQPGREAQRVAHLSRRASR